MNSITEQEAYKSLATTYGPMELEISMLDPWNSNLAREGIKYGITTFEKVVKNREIVSRPSSYLEKKNFHPSVINRMIEATSIPNFDDLTPLASVAGAISDEVKNFLLVRGAENVVVNNGGDISINLKNKPIKIGILRTCQSPKADKLIEISPNSKIGGVATSGLGGRGFTKGIADSVTMLSTSGAKADALATIVGNSTRIKNEKQIRKRKASELDPTTDIPNQLITVSREGISAEEKKEAVENGLKTAKELDFFGTIIKCGEFTGYNLDKEISLVEK